MNKIRILIVGLVAISASYVCMAIAAAPLPPVATEKVVAPDLLVDHLPAFDVAVCDFDALKVSICIEREAVSYVVRESSTAGRSAVTYAKVSAHGRMCGLTVAASPRSHPLTYYGQRT